MKWVKGPFTPEVLKMQCIHGDIREYRMKMVTIGIGSQIFTCRVGVVSQLNCGIQLGLFHIVPTITEDPTLPHTNTKMALLDKPMGVELPICRDELTQLTDSDPSLQFDKAAAREQPPATE